MAIRYVTNTDPVRTVPLVNDEDKTLLQLMWGDPVHVSGTDGDWSQVWARGEQGWVETRFLGDEGLLELYVIDVGQGDGVLLRTPDDKWHLVDAGVSNAKQMTKKGAANFLRWKFVEDLRRPGISLENMILSHPDFDHYGGLIDVLSGQLHDGRTFEISVKNLLHPGMGRFKDAPRLGAAVAGEVGPLPFPEYGVKTSDTFITELLDKKTSFSKPKRPFDEAFAEFAKLAGSVPENVRRLTSADGWVPGYDEQSASGVSMKVLGPILEEAGGAVGMRELGSESVTRNGHSLVLRLDYGRARILLTGDLNTESQRLLLSYHNRLDFAADVAKGCHHGSDDIDLRFVRAMNARAMVISSGDNESYAHPRPRVMGASARYGREAKSAKDGKVLPPLLYSTELARSVSLAYASALTAGGDKLKVEDARVRLEGKGEKERPLERTALVKDLVYGLVNVRTDGETILIGTMRESGKDFELQAFKAGVDP